MKAAELARARAESRAAEERQRRLLAVGLAAAVVAVVALGAGGGAWVPGWAAEGSFWSPGGVSGVLLILHSLVSLMGRA